MNWKTFKGQALILVCGLFFAAGVVVFFTNVKNSCDLWFGKNLSGSTGMVMLISAVVGMATIFVFKLLLRGVRDLRIGRLQASLRRVDKMGKIQAQAPKQPPADPS
ncbi:MAG: hypothetical protein JW849_01340 [Phycisphaerae bacterium]|nr:hypothetical protein [Phycisphaerae bacterium]